MVAGALVAGPRQVVNAGWEVVTAGDDAADDWTRMRGYTLARKETRSVGPATDRPKPIARTVGPEQERQSETGGTGPNQERRVETLARKETRSVGPGPLYR